MKDRLSTVSVGNIVKKMELNTTPFTILLEQTLRRAHVSVLNIESKAVATVDAAEVYAIALRDGWNIDIARVIRRTLAKGPVLDSLGHRRPVYEPLLLYAFSQTLRLVGPANSSDLRSEVEAAARQLSSEVDPQIWTAARGQHAGKTAWSALANFSVAMLYGDQIAQDQSALFFDQMRAARQPTGAWLRTGPSDNIETHGYDELILLHAIASYRSISGRTDFDDAIAANAAFHSRELQPDHATNQPWALHALAASPAIRPLADQLLHAAIAQQPGGLHGLPVVLVADALYGLRSIQSVTDKSADFS